MSDSREQELISKMELLEKEKEALERENALLREKINFLSRRLFGKKSEQLSAAQLMLLFQEFESPGPLLGKEFGPEELAAQPPRPKRSKPQQKRRIDLSQLPVVEERLEPPQVQAAPNHWRCIGEEVSERLDVEPARFFRVRTIRPTYVKRDEPEVAPVTAPLPPTLLERSIITPGLLAHIIVNKYCDHLPLYRQETILATRHGLDIPRQTMVEWVRLGADWLKPIYEEIRKDVFARGYVQIDETPIRYLAPGNGKTKLGFLWTVCDPQGDVLFAWEISRAAACLERLVPIGYRGKIQCDGFSAYDAFARLRGELVTLGGCLSHARRGFVDAVENAPRTVAWILIQFRNLYAIEQKLRKARAGPALREAVRSAESAPIMNRIQKALIALESSKRFLPRSVAGKASRYALEQWPALCLYLTDGRLEIDNNLVENAIRPTAIGKKNWLFVGDAHAGERGAILYTIVENCRRIGVDPFAYLRDVFTRLPSMTNWQVKDVTPRAWLAAKKKREKAAD